jgi:5'(3')-deoxyribonucleotidase
MDGIIVDTLPTWLQRIYWWTGVKVNPDDITQWDLIKDPALSKLQPSQIFDILDEKHFTLQLPEMPEATRFLEKLHDAGHEINVVTARFGMNCMPETISWLQEMMPWFNAKKKTFFCYDKHRITGDILIDDKAENLVRYNQEYPNAKLITIDYPFNKDTPAGTFRARKDGCEWEQIEFYIRKKLAKPTCSWCGDSEEMHGGMGHSHHFEE